MGNIKKFQIESRWNFQWKKVWSKFFSFHVLPKIEILLIIYQFPYTFIQKEHLHFISRHLFLRKQVDLCDSLSK